MDIEQNRFIPSVGAVVKGNLAVLLAGWLLVVATAMHNIGIVALDDYSNGISLMIPAQRQVPVEAYASRGVHPPLPKFALTRVSQFVWRLGVESPVWQLRWSLAIIGSLAFWLVAASLLPLLAPLSDRHVRIAACALSFYFVLPFVFTRPMIETLAMPWLALSTAASTRYFFSGNRKALCLAVVFLAVAALFRFQVGVCGLVVLFLVGMKRDWRGLSHVSLLGLLLFGLTGAVDIAFGKGFHESLLAYVKENIERGSSYGVSPFYTFALLFIGLSLPPALFSRFRGMPWRIHYSRLIPVLAYFIVFFVAHSLNPHKEERFMIPVLPHFLVLAVPLVAHLLAASGSGWRRWYLIGLNTLLLVPASFGVAQRNVIDLALFVAKRPEIERLYSFDGSLVMFPDSYAGRVVPYINHPAEGLVSERSCQAYWVIRADKLADVPASELARLRPVATFNPDWLEAVLVKANPRQNRRRGPLHIFSPTECVVPSN